MSESMRKVGLIGIGATLGALLTLGFSAVANKEPSLPLPVEDLRAFADVFGRIKNDYVETVPDKKLIREAINGMVAGLDPHSTFLDEDAFKDLQATTQGQFGGLGIEVGMKDGFVRVTAPIDDTPASRAGIRAGDLIIKIDDTFVKGLSLDKAVKRMRGEPGTKITLTIRRDGEEKDKVVTLERAVIKPETVKARMIEPGYAWLRIGQFQENTPEVMANKLNDLYKTTSLKGLVLDLRDDPGGLLHGAVAISAAFLPKDVLVVYTDGRSPEAKMRLTASKEHYIRGMRKDFLKDLPPQVKSVPMVVLVNGGSASASEIVAGALQDHKRATLIGTSTFGKGSVQTILPLGNNTAIKLTTAKYYTPNGRSIQAKGIEPDLVVEQVSTNGYEEVHRPKEAELIRHIARLRGDEEAAAAEDKDREDAKAAKDAKDGKEIKLPEKYRTPSELYGTTDDFQLLQALNHLKGRSVLSKALPATAEPQAVAQQRAAPAGK